MARIARDFPCLGAKKPFLGSPWGAPHLLCVRMCLRIRVNLSETPDELREEKRAVKKEEKRKKGRKREKNGGGEEKNRRKKKGGKKKGGKKKRNHLAGCAD